LFGKISLFAGDAILAGVIGFDGAGERGCRLRKMWRRRTAQKISQPPVAVLLARQVRSKKKRLRGVRHRFGKSLGQPGAHCFVQIFLDTLVDFGTEAGAAGHGSHLGRRQQGRRVAAMLFQLFAHGVGPVAGFFTPLRARINSKVVLPVIERLSIKELMFRDNGAIKERNRIVGLQLQGLA
jgi:hypothetical protein